MKKYLKLFKNKTILVLLSVAVLACYSCSKTAAPDNPDAPGGNQISAVTIKANKFVYDYTMEAYLWNKQIPAIDYKKEKSPEELFDKMKNKTLDKWSYVSDKSDDVMSEFAGVSTTFGYSLAFGKFSNSDNYFAIVKYIYENSPAEKAGLKRGDILLTLDDKSITASTYLNLYYGSKIKVGLGEVTKDNTIAESGKSVEMAAVKMYENPILKHTVLDVDNHKIAYLAYSGFYAESHEALKTIVADFIVKGATDLVIDLRYNPGGNAVTPPFIGSLIAPTAAVKAGKVFLTESWNDNYTKYYKDKGEKLEVYFKDEGVSLNLNTVYVLTTSGTASASEALISGLTPYMNVVKIGTTTHGKYCGAALLRPYIADNKLDPDIKNWLLSLVIYKFVNVNGFTDFVNGIDPDYKVEDDLVRAVYPLGDPNDPHFAQAISLITGKASGDVKSSPVEKVKGVQMLPQLDERPNRGGYVRLIQ